MNNHLKVPSILSKKRGHTVCIIYWAEWNPKPWGCGGDEQKLLPVSGIKMDLQEVGWGVMAWIDMAQDRDRWRAVVSAVMNLRVP
jgi:hypothetical protein